MLRKASHIDFVHKKSYGRSSGDPPTLETSRTFFDTAEAPETLFFLQV